jgi:hypothetical protein
MKFTRYYTAAEVNQMIPELKRQLEHLQTIKHDHQLKLDELQELKLAMVKSNAPPNDTGGDPFFVIECEIEFLEMQAKQMLQQFAEREILVKSIDAGLVDFPAIIDGDVVLLCWLKDEPLVKHYHSLQDGFWGRRKLSEE